MDFNELPEPFHSLDSDLGYAQLGGHLVECVTESGTLPLDLRNGSEQSSLHAGIVLQAIVATCNSGKNAFHHVIKPGALILYRSDEPYPPRLWAGGREYHIISPEDIELQIAYDEEIDNDDDEEGDEIDDEEDTYGEVLEPGEIIAEYEQL